jgi:hypothetical protein
MLDYWRWSSSWRVRDWTHEMPHRRMNSLVLCFITWSIFSARIWIPPCQISRSTFTIHTLTQASSIITRPSSVYKTPRPWSYLSVFCTPASTNTSWFSVPRWLTFRTQGFILVQTNAQRNVAVNGLVARVHAVYTLLHKLPCSLGPKRWLHGPTIYTIKK